MYPALLPKRVGSRNGYGCPPGGQRRNDEGAQMLVQLVGRDHHTRAGLANLAPPRRVERDQQHITALHRPLYHFQAPASKRVAVCSRELSSPRLASFAAASAQPGRTALLGGCAATRPPARRLT